MRAVGNKIAVERKKTTSRTTSSGLYVPETADDATVVSGKVISIGEDVKHVKEDDVIHFNKTQAEKITVDNQDYFIVHGDYVLAVE